MIRTTYTQTVSGVGVPRRSRLAGAGIACCALLLVVGFLAPPVGRDWWITRTSSTTPPCSPSAARALARDPVFTSAPVTAKVSTPASGSCHDVDGSDAFIADARYVVST